MRIVVVGGSLAGLRAAEELRHRGFAGTITVVGDETREPYDRPPLSKQVLSGAWPLERTALSVTHPGGLAGLDLDWRLGVRATGLDLASRRVVLGDDDVPFDGLVVATGATPASCGEPSRWRGSTHCARSTTASPCGPHSTAGSGRVVVVGAGFIGAEVAATCRTAGCDVTILEALPVPLGRALGDEMGAVMGELHRDHGVDLRLGVGVAGFEGGDRVDARPAGRRHARRRRPGGRRHRRHRPTPGGSRGRGWRSTTGSCATPPPSPPRASWRPATWPAGPATASAS